MHEITATDSTFSVREMPWMGLLDGQVHVLPDNPTREVAQALVMPWEPVTESVYRKVPRISPEGVLTEEYEVIESAQAVVRSDGPLLGVTSSTLGMVTNNELWDVVEAVGSIGTDIEIETGGTLRGGKDVWALLRLTEPLRVKGDPHGDTLSFMAFQNNHIGTGAFRGQAINTRIVCANTSKAADAEAKANGYEFTFRHGKNVGDRIEEAKAAVAMWREGVTVWLNAMEHLNTVTVTPEQREEFVQQFQPMPRLATDRVRGNVEAARQELRTILTGPTTEGISHTAYGLFQAGVEWDQHYRTVKGGTEQARMESHFRRSVLDHDSLRKATLTLAREVAHA